MHQVLEHRQAVLNHQVIGSLGPSESRPHDPSELCTCIQEILRMRLEEIPEEPRIVNWVQREPVLLRLRPSQQMLQHLAEFGYEFLDFAGDVCGVGRARDRVERRQVVLDCIRHELRRNYDVVVYLLFEWHYLQLRLLPFVLYC